MFSFPLEYFRLTIFSLSTMNRWCFAL